MKAITFRPEPNSLDLLQLDDAEFEKLKERNPEVIGIPVHFRIVGMGIEVWPAPAKGWSVRIVE